MPSAAFIPWSNVEVHVLGCKYHIIRSVNIILMPYHSQSYYAPAP